MENKDAEHDAEEFQPKGALAFFVILMVFFTITWFVLYFELLSRG